MNKKILIAVIAGVCLLAGVIIAVAAGCNSGNKEQETTEASVETTEEILTTEEVITTEEVKTSENVETTEEATPTTEEVVTTEEVTEPEVTEEITEAPVQEPATEIQTSNSGVSDVGLPYDVATLTTAGQTSQIVMAVGDGSLTGCTVYLFEKGDDLVWRMTLTTPGFWGRNGISYHTIEGDQTTPAGAFDLGLAFGNSTNPGTALEWVDVNPYMYWIDDVNSEYYNLLIDSRGVPDGWSSGEHLSQIVPEYNYSINIEVNPTRRKDSTSAIFLHCGSKPTAGCVGIPEDCMITILQRLKPGAKMIIAENASTVSLY